MMAAEHNSSEGMFFVGNAYQFGHGTETDFKESAHWYEKALMHGDLPGQQVKVGLFNLGLLYNTGGPGLEVDQEKAIKWWAVGDRVGSPNCIFNLGVMFLNGTGVPADLNLALTLFQKVRKIDPSFELPHQIKHLLDDLDRKKVRESKAHHEGERRGKSGASESPKLGPRESHDTSGHPVKQTTGTKAPAGSTSVWEYVGFGLLTALVVVAFVFGTPKAASK